MEYGLCVEMENVEGLTFNTLLTVAQARGRYFSEAFILYVGAEVAAALDYAHTRTDDAGLPLGIVNRDVNPARIRLDPHGQVRLTDFGVALSRLAGRLASSLLRPQGEVGAVASTRHPDEVTTAPGEGTRGVVGRQPTA